LVQIQQDPSIRKALWYSRKALETYEDLEEDLKKGQEKVKSLIRRCREDSVVNKLW